MEIQRVLPILSEWERVIENERERERARETYNVPVLCDVCEMKSS